MFWRPAGMSSDLPFVSRKSGYVESRVGVTDGNETSAAYLVALNAIHTPSVLALSRQNLPQLELSSIEKAARGGYIVHEPAKRDLILISTGSEVAIAIESAKILAEKGIQARVVSMPCFEVFDQQSREYQLSILPDGVPVLSVEAYSVRFFAEQLVFVVADAWWECS
jgi:transketolase